MTAIPHLVGMVHLDSLPGSPRFSGSLSEVVRVAVSDATALAEAGFPALLIENFGDAPFYSDRVPPETVAAMTVAITKVAEAAGLPFGVNVLRNDGRSALAIAAATGASFIRVNVLTGLMYTDQGPIVGDAADLVRTRATLGPDVEIWADVMVKHAVPPPGLEVGQAAADTVERGLADAVIVSGAGTGLSPDLKQAREVGGAIPTETRLVIGSGVTPDNIAELMRVADAVIVGSTLKRDGVASNAVDPGRAARFVAAARENGLI